MIIDAIADVNIIKTQRTSCIESIEHFSKYCSRMFADELLVKYARAVRAMGGAIIAWLSSENIAQAKEPKVHHAASWLQ